MKAYRVETDQGDQQPDFKYFDSLELAEKYQNSKHHPPFSFIDEIEIITYDFETYKYYQIVFILHELIDGTEKESNSFISSSDNSIDEEDFIYKKYYAKHKYEVKGKEYFDRTLVISIPRNDTDNDLLVEEKLSQSARHLMIKIKELESTCHNQININHWLDDQDLEMW